MVYKQISLIKSTVNDQNENVPIYIKLELLNYLCIKKNTIIVRPS